VVLENLKCPFELNPLDIIFSGLYTIATNCWKSKYQKSQRASSCVSLFLMKVSGRRGFLRGKRKITYGGGGG